MHAYKEMQVTRLIYHSIDIIQNEIKEMIIKRR